MEVLWSKAETCISVASAVLILKKNTGLGVWGCKAHIKPPQNRGRDEGNVGYQKERLSVCSLYSCSPRRSRGHFPATSAPAYLVFSHYQMDMHTSRVKLFTSQRAPEAKRVIYKQPVPLQH